MSAQGGIVVEEKEVKYIYIINNCNKKMGNQGKVICRLCLKICDNFEAIEGDIKDVLDVLLPKINLAAMQEAVMCTNCTEKLINCFDFKATCFYTHDYIFPFINDKNCVKLDLIDIYQRKNKNSTYVAEDQDICGFCMRPVESCSLISLDVTEGDFVLEDMIERCLPELDLSIIKKPVICAPCHNSLNDCFRFVTKCLVVEEEIKKYCETLDIDSKDQIELTSLLQFKVKDVTTTQVDEAQFASEIASLSTEARRSSKIDVVKREETFYEQNELKEGYLVEYEDQKGLRNEEVEIKAEGSDFNRLDGIMSPQPEVTTSRLRWKRKDVMLKLEGDLSNPSLKHKLTIKNISATRTFQCHYCAFSTKYKAALKRHVLRHKDPSEVIMYKCDFCLFQTKQKAYLSVHLLKHVDPSEGKIKKCDSCSYQTIHTSHLKRHMLVHTDSSQVTLYKCHVCSFQTKHKTALNTHALKHEDSSVVTMYKCNFCSHQTRYINRLRRHLLVHEDTSKVTYNCDNCPYQTKSKRRLQIHMRKYKDSSKITVHKCDTCSYQSRSISHLKRHLLVHKTASEVTLYKCDSCSFHTKYKNVLMSHILRHKDPSELIMYKCEYCSYQTRTKYNVKIHSLVHKKK